jgi:hypothetical protein
MELWQAWLSVVYEFQPACARVSTFYWLVIILASFTVRSDHVGVSSFVRCHWLREKCYNRILDQFAGSGIKLGLLTTIWAKVALKIFARFLVKEGDRVVLLADGVKNPKEGRKMPGVKLCHQESNNNSKPEYIMAHSLQAVSLLVSSLGVYFGVPLVARIHEGIVLSNRDKRTLYDKLNLMISNLSLPVSYYLVADAYYSCRKMAKAAVAKGNHLISRCRTTAVAYFPAAKPDKVKRGRPQKYGEKVKLRDFFAMPALFTEIDSPFPDEAGVKVQYMSINLIWRPIGCLVKFVLVNHPKGKWILIGTDLELDPIRMMALYGLRFRIELCFKQLIYVVGAFAYRFWLRGMKKLRRGGGDQYLHRMTEDMREKILGKLQTYNLHVQLAIIALGLMQWLSLSYPKLVWRNFGSWMRTMNKKMPPSELIVAYAMRNTLADFLVSLPGGHKLAKFLAKKLDFSRLPVPRMAG